jgi:hypothetical protein
MATQHSRIALYKDSTHRFFFDGLAHLQLRYSEPAIVDTDRLGLESIIEPASSPYNQRWATAATLLFLRPRYLLRHAQIFASGAWGNDVQSDNSTVLVNWLFTHCIEARQEFVIFVEAHGYKQGGTEYFRRRYYKGKAHGVRQGENSTDWLWGDLSSSSSLAGPRWLALPFVITDEGSFTDFNSIAGITTRGTRPV